MQIVVTGPHRSGASALARLLHLSGVYVADSLTSPQDSIQDESSRVWERVDLVGLNEWLISKAGADALDVYSFDINLLGQAEMWEFHQRAATILEAVSPHRPFFLKDPRFCLTLPMWEPLLEQPIVIFVQRSPLECARSLAHRSGIAFSAALALWEFYVNRFASWSGSSRSLIVRYEDLVSDPDATLANVMSRLRELGVKNLEPPSSESVSKAVFRPSRCPGEPSMAHIPESIETLSRMDFSGEAVPELSDEAKHEMQVFHSSRMADARWSRRLRLIEEESLRMQIGNLRDRQIEKLKIQNKKLKTRNGALKTENGALKTENEAWKTENEAWKTENEELRTHKNELKTRCEALRHVFKSLDREMSELKAAPFWSVLRLKGAFRVLSKGDLKRAQRAVAAFKEGEKSR